MIARALFVTVAAVAAHSTEGVAGRQVPQSRSCCQLGLSTLHQLSFTRRDSVGGLISSVDESTLLVCYAIDPPALAERFLFDGQSVLDEVAGSCFALAEVVLPM